MDQIAFFNFNFHEKYYYDNDADHFLIRKINGVDRETMKEGD